MKIIKFYAEKVNGYQTHDIYFDGKLNFLVGINGSGKTTLLKLIQATLSLSIKDFYSIKFDRLILEIDTGKENITIKVSRDGEKIRYNISGHTEEMVFPDPSFLEKNITDFYEQSKIIESLDATRMKLIQDGGSIIATLLSLPKPIFLGLERKLDDDFDFEDTPRIRSRNMRLHNNFRSIETNSMISGLINTEQYIKNAYRRFRRISDHRYPALVEMVAKSAFEYIEFDPSWVERSKEQLNKEYSNINERKAELSSFIESVQSNRPTRDDVDFEAFFQKIDSLYRHTIDDDSKKDQFDLEWILNYSQLKRLLQMLDKMEQMKQIEVKAYEPINQFIMVANEFFKEGGKRISVDSVGNIEVTRSGKSISIHNLSSGEKQLIILLSHVIFSQKNMKSPAGIIIIDEPELSLHLIWQQELVNRLTTIGADIQFIFATHSPEIIGDKKDKCIRVKGRDQ